LPDVDGLLLQPPEVLVQGDQAVLPRHRDEPGLLAPEGEDAVGEVQLPAGLRVDELLDVAGPEVVRDAAVRIAATLADDYLIMYAEVRFAQISHRVNVLVEKQGETLWWFTSRVGVPY